VSTADIFESHRQAWRTKAALRHYYRHEIFDRIIAETRVGPTLEIGAGPGFFSDYHPGMTGLDVMPSHPSAIPGDVHAMPFADAAFANVVGVDVLHHLARPGQALREIARVLEPGGRLILVEPWAGPAGRLFYRHFHHEDCTPVKDPWTAAFPEGKNAMDGNAIIPWAVLFAGREDMRAHAPLAIRRCVAFGILSYAATGGFQRFGLPWLAVDALRRFERALPQAVHRFAALRALFVLERV
jgi:SAM-dependent methyltransferase